MLHGAVGVVLNGTAAEATSGEHVQQRFRAGQPAETTGCTDIEALRFLKRPRSDGRGADVHLSGPPGCIDVLGWMRMSGMTSEPGPAERRATTFLAACIEGGLDVLVLPAGESPRRNSEVAGGTVDVVVHREVSDGSFRILRVAEVLGVEDGVVQLQELFRHEAGELRATGLVPELLDQLHDQGITLDPLIFAPRRRGT